MRAFQILLFLIITVCFSCEEAYIANCDECTTEEPENAKLSIVLSDYADGSTDVRIYEGDLEDNILFASFSVVTLGHDVSVPLNKRYTVTALYRIDGVHYTAVDSAFPRIRYDEAQCDDPCYFVYDNKINLKLRTY